MSDRIDKVTRDLWQTAEDFRRTFGTLTVEQLNWKPAAKSWSVAQCVDHLIKTHERFIPVLARYELGKASQSLWARYSPLSGFFGQFLIRSLMPDNPKKIKTTWRGKPSSSEIDAGIVERYCDHQHELIEQMRRLPDDLDLAKAIITSPMLGVFTYSIDDWLTIAVIHGQRHFEQAKRVTATAGFPVSRATAGVMH
jgi:hypothetical protein